MSLALDIKGANQVNPVFARHETFHPRFGWLKKGFDAASRDASIFLQEDAPVRLGVGKNMVNSIRYWCNTFKILKEDSPTDFGQNLLGEEGWDPFLEDPASLWLLHWNLLKPSCNAAAWYYTFNVFHSVEFSLDELFNALCNYRDSIAPRIVDASVKKDVTLVLRMYVEQGTLAMAGKSEDSIDCPFALMGLLHTAGDARHYTFRVGVKRNLPAQIVVAAALEYASSVGKQQRTISISRLLYDIGSPGMAFKLSESAVCDAIEQVAKQTQEIALSDSAGLIQFSFTSEPDILARDILDNYYRGRRSRAKNE